MKSNSWNYDFCCFEIPQYSSAIMIDPGNPENKTWQVSAEKIAVVSFDRRFPKYEHNQQWKSQPD